MGLTLLPNGEGLEELQISDASEAGVDVLLLSEVAKPFARGTMGRCTELLVTLLEGVPA